MYFIHDGNRQLGPLTFTELKERKILATTPVWKEGLTKWVNASSLDELNDLFISSPPAFNYTAPLSANKTTVTEKIGFRLGRFFGMGGLILVLSLLGVFIYDQWNSRTVYNHYSSEPVVDPEHSNPSLYVGASGTYHPNFWGDKLVLNGKVANNATHTNYKDIRIKVNFFSQTSSLISSEEYILYDYVPYHSTKDFTLKVNRPPAAASCGWTAVGATFY